MFKHVICVKNGDNHTHALLRPVRWLSSHSSWTLVGQGWYVRFVNRKEGSLGWKQWHRGGNGDEKKGGQEPCQRDRRGEESRSRNSGGDPLTAARIQHCAWVGWLQIFGVFITKKWGLEVTVNKVQLWALVCIERCVFWDKEYSHKIGQAEIRGELCAVRRWRWWWRRAPVLIKTVWAGYFCQSWDSPDALASGRL